MFIWLYMGTFECLNMYNCTFECLNRCPCVQIHSIHSVVILEQEQICRCTCIDCRSNVMPALTPLPPPNSLQIRQSKCVMFDSSPVALLKTLLRSNHSLSVIPLLLSFSSFPCCYLATWLKGSGIFPGESEEHRYNWTHVNWSTLEGKCAFVYSPGIVHGYNVISEQGPCLLVLTTAAMLVSWKSNEISCPPGRRRPIPPCVLVRCSSLGGFLVSHPPLLQKNKIKWTAAWKDKHQSFFSFNLKILFPPREREIENKLYTLLLKRKDVYFLQRKKCMPWNRTVKINIISVNVFYGSSEFLSLRIVWRIFPITLTVLALQVFVSVPVFTFWVEFFGGCIVICYSSTTYYSFDFTFQNKSWKWIAVL